MSGSSLGYTKSQARALKNAIDRDIAAIEDRVYRMRTRVTDTGYGFMGDTALEDLREIANELKEIVDRRTATA